MSPCLLATFLVLAADAAPAPPTINGAWMLSDAWAGYMGITLAIEDDEFKYRFSSDVTSGDEPEYPIRGKVRYRGDLIVLEPKNGEDMYSKE